MLKSLFLSLNYLSRYPDPKFQVTLILIIAALIFIWLFGKWWYQDILGKPIENYYALTAIVILFFMICFLLITLI